MLATIPIRKPHAVNEFVFKSFVGYLIVKYIQFAHFAINEGEILQKWIEISEAISEFCFNIFAAFGAD